MNGKPSHRIIPSRGFWHWDLFISLFLLVSEFCVRNGIGRIKNVVEELAEACTSTDDGDFQKEKL